MNGLTICNNKSFVCIPYKAYPKASTYHKALYDTLFITKNSPSPNCTFRQHHNYRKLMFIPLIQF